MELLSILKLPPINDIYLLPPLSSLRHAIVSESPTTAEPHHTVLMCDVQTTATEFCFPGQGIIPTPPLRQKKKTTPLSVSEANTIKQSRKNMNCCSDAPPLRLWRWICSHAGLLHLVLRESFARSCRNYRCRSTESLSCVCLVLRTAAAAAGMCRSGSATNICIGLLATTTLCASQFSSSEWDWVTV